MQYFEGGSLIPNKSPGASPSLTSRSGAARRGTATSSTGSQDVAITSSGLGLTDRELQAQPRHRAAGPRRPPLRRWSLSRAWPGEFVAGGWDNENDERASSRSRFSSKALVQ